MWLLIFIAWLALVWLIVMFFKGAAMIGECKPRPNREAG